VQNIEVGQQLWAVTIHGRDSFVTVTKVGRKWIHAKGLARDQKIDASTLEIIVDGYGNRGQCYLSKEKWEDEQERLTAWSDFRDEIRNLYKMPDDMSVNRINDARRILGIA